MGLAQKKPSFVTPQEYLTLEREAEFRHEYLNGEIFEMAGGTKRHSLISTNLARLIGNQILDRNCNVFDSDMRIKIPNETYTYADIVALCGEEHFEDEAEDTLLNPSVIFLVLSKSTEAYDRGAKFEQYQTIESLQEYVLITQGPFRVEQRQDVNSWTCFEFRKPEDLVRLNSIDCELGLKDIYHKVEQKFPKELG